MSPSLLSQRYKKFLENPSAFFYFIKKNTYDIFICDNYVHFYKGINFLTPEETFNHIIDRNCSLVRFGDGEFAYIHGAGVYFNDWHQTYNKDLQQGLLRVLSSQSSSLLICLPGTYLTKTKEELHGEYVFWIHAKMILHKYLNSKQVYGSSFTFYPTINTNLDYVKLKKYFEGKHIIIITSNTSRFETIKLGITTHLIESPKSNSWSDLPNLKATLFKMVTDNNLPKEKILVMVSMGPAAKVMVYDLAQEGFTAWDAGQFFDVAYKNIKEL